MRTPSDRAYPARIRQILRAHPDGLAIPPLCAKLQVDRRSKTVYDALHRMPDAYIDRWEAFATDGRHGGHRAVWRVVEVPAHCPRPEK